MDDALAEIYAVYSDYAMKNPFYELEMPVRGEKFERGVRQAVMAKEGKGGYLR
jgi:trafficking protein particle complex subunit 4